MEVRIIFISCQRAYNLYVFQLQDLFIQWPNWTTSACKSRLPLPFPTLYILTIIKIKTSYDRSAFFGPICARNDGCTGWSAAVPDDQSVITGIIIDTLARHHTQILSIGTRRAGPIENSHASSPAFPISVPVSNFQRWPMFERANSTGMASHSSYAFLDGSTFVTTASLDT